MEAPIFYRKEIKISSQEKVSWFIGFKLLLKDQNIRILNISRLLNNLAYVTWTATLPLLLAKIAQGDMDFFAQMQAISASLVSGGFILASLFGTWLAKERQLMKTMVWGSSILGFTAMVLLILSLSYKEILYLSAFFLGLGTYCFRISGMTLGQAFTPIKMLGAVIIAGDSVVRGWSFFVSLAVVSIIGLQETFSITTLGTLVLILPGFSLVSPFLIGRLAKTFIERKQEEEST